MRMRTCMLMQCMYVDIAIWTADSATMVVAMAAGKGNTRLPMPTTMMPRLLRIVLME